MAGGAPIPPPGLIRCGPRRATPYLCSNADIAALVEAAGALPRPVSAITYQTMIGLLAVTGMRVGEAIGLDRDDFDADHDGLLTVREAKFAKTRQIPLHPSTVSGLRGSGGPMITAERNSCPPASRHGTMAQGEIHAIHVGRLRKVPVDTLREYVDRQRAIAGDTATAHDNAG